MSDRVPDFLSHVLAHATPGQVAAVVEMPARASAGAPWPEWVAPEVKDALANRGIRELWSHQAEAAELLHGGAHTVVATGTGSGKSLAAWIPALDLLSRRGRGRSGLANIRYRPSVLYLAPTKALAADQLVGLARLARDGSASRRPTATPKPPSSGGPANTPTSSFRTRISSSTPCSPPMSVGPGCGGAWRWW